MRTYSHIRPGITICITLLFANLFYGYSQNKEFHIHGIVKDQAGNVVLPGAAVMLLNNQKGTVTDEYGKFHIVTPDTAVQLHVQYLGYENFRKWIKLNRDTLIRIFLKSESITSHETVITRQKTKTSSPEIGKVKLLQKDIELIPSLGGERDILKTLMLTPGIQSVSEGSSGLYVRGGNAGQNLILLEEMPLYNPNHLLGFFPVFNAPVVKNVEITKGIDDAETGGRLSSVVKVNMKDGDEKKLGGEINTGLLSSSVTLHGPMTKKTQFLVSGRTTYLGFLQDLVLKKVMKNNNFIQNTRYSFHDFYGKFTHNFSIIDRLKLTFYGGFDNYKLRNTSINFQNKMDWNNLAAAATWTHSFGTDFYSKVTTGYTSYQHDMNATFNDYLFALGSQINDYFVTTTITNNTLNNHLIKTGFTYTYHWNNPGETEAEALTIDYKKKDVYHSNEVTAFVNDEITLSTALTISAGIRHTWFTHVGPYKRYGQNYNEAFESFNKGEIVYSRHLFEPRLVANYEISQNHSVKGGFAKISQPVHLIPVGGVSLPADIWFTSTGFAPPATSSQFSLGYFRKLEKIKLEFSAEIYHKQMKGLIERKKSILNNFDEKELSESFASGSGKSSGLELLLSRTEGKINGWISYTLSKSIREFPELNNGEPFVSKYDRPHDLSVVANYNMNEHWSFSAIFVYATGNAMTMPVGRYMIQGVVMNDYTNVNGYRLPDYHRLDVSVNRRIVKNWGEYIWNFSVYNIYNRSNPYYLFFDVEANIDNYFLSVKSKSVSLYPVLPSISLIVKF